MANFDIDQYLAAKREAVAINTPDPVSVDTPNAPDITPAPTNIADKLAEVYRASIQKVNQLITDTGNIKIAQNPVAPNQDTLVQGFNKVMGRDSNHAQFYPTSAAVVDGVARLASGAARTAGATIAAIPAAVGAASYGNLTEQDFADYNAVKTNEASNSPENMDLEALARLDAPIKRRTIRGVVAPDQSTDGAFSPNIEKPPTYTKRIEIERFLASQKNVNAVANAFDISHIVDRSIEKKLADRATKDVADVQAQYADAAQSWANGDRLTAAYKKSKAIGADVSGTVKDFVNTPEAIIPAVLENLPQALIGLLPGGLVLQAAGNLGNSAELVAKGIIDDKAKTGDAIPSFDQVTKQYAAGAGAALLETVGDKVSNIAGLGAIKSVEGLKASVLKPLVNAATKVDVGGAVGSVAKVTGKVGLATGVEGFTEHFQSPLENIAENVPYDALGQRVSAVMGMAGGTGLSTPSAVISAIADKATQISDKRNATEAEASTFYKAATTNDASAYTDPTAKTYDPVKAAGVYFTHSQQEGTTSEVKAENLAKVSSLETQLQVEVQANTVSLKEAITSPQAKSVILDQIEALQSSLRDASPEADLKNNAELNALWAQHDKPDLAPADVKDLRAKTNTLEQQLAQITAMRTRLELETGAQGSQDTVNAQRASTEVPVTPANKQDSGGYVDTREYKDLQAKLNTKLDQWLKMDLVNTPEEKRAFYDANIKPLNDQLRALEGKATTPVADIPVNQTINQTVAPVATTPAAPAKAVQDAAAVAQARATSSDATGMGTNFPIQTGNDGYVIPAAMMIPYAAQIVKNHTQSMGKIANRGGLSPAEVIAGFMGFRLDDRLTNDMKAQGVTHEQLGVTIQQLGENFQTNPDAVKEFIAGYPGSMQPNLASADVAINQSMASTPKTTTVDTAAGTQATEKTVEDQNASVPEASTNKEKNVGGLDVLNQPVSPKGTAYNLRNVITDYFTQNAGKDTNGTQRPLVKVRDFLSSLLASPDLAAEFVKGKELTERQQSAVAFFAKTAKAWNPTVQEALFKRADPTYYASNDPLQFLFTEVLDANGKPTGKFDADENFKTAISYAAFSTIQDMAGNGELNSQSTINKMLGRLDDHEVTPQEWKTLGRIGTLQGLLANAAGQVAYEALGFQVKNMETWNNLPAQVKTAMGAHVMKLLIEQGYIQRHRINATEISAMRGYSSAGVSDVTTNYTGLENLSYFTLAREGKPTDLQRSLTGELQQIVDSVKGTQGILDKVFSIESATRWPSLEPLEPHQVNAKNSDQLVPDTLGTIIDKKLKEVNKLRQDVWHVLGGFTKDFTLELMGKEDSTQAQKGRRLSVNAKNQSLEREFDNYRELGNILLSTGTEDLGQPFFLDYSVWKQHRVGIATNGFNPNSSKAQRQQSYQPDWETEIDKNDSAQMDNFYLGVAEGFGIATDNVPNAVSLVNIKARFAQADVVEAVELLRQRIVSVDPDPFTDAEQQKIVSLVKKGKENLHSLNSLIALAHFSEAVKTGSNTFTAQIPAERDGKTNGPMLANAFFGVGSSPAELFKTLNRGGFFEVGNPDTQFNIWKGKGNLDLYEKGTGGLLRNLQWLIAEKKVFGFIKDTVLVFTKSLTDPKTGDINSTGRNMMKKPSQEVVYGSSSKTTVDNMAEVFIESVFARIEEVAKDDLSHMTLPKLIKELNSLLYGTDTKFKHNDTAQYILDYEFTKEDFSAMKAKFVKTLGVAVKETVKSDFHAFTQKTQIFTATAGLTFSIYKAVYDTARKDYIKELTELGEFDVNPAFERREKNGKISRISAKQTHDLNAAQEKVLKKRVLAVYPIMHSLFSKESKQLEAGLFISKTERKLSKDPNYQVEVQFGTPIKDVGESRVSMAAMQINQVGPGVAMLPNSIQASDSYISHTVQAEMNALNQHDALITGLGKTKEAAQLLNAATWKLLLNYSPATEMYESFVRNLLGMEEMLAKKEVSKDALALFAASIVEQTYRMNGPDSDAPIDPHQFLGIHLAMMKDMSYRADSMKFSTLGLTASIDQYTFEGGNFAVGEKLREEALAKKAELVAGIDPETQDAVDSLEQRLQTAITAATIAANEKIKGIDNPEAVNVTEQELEALRTESREDVSINNTVADHLTNAQAFALLSHALKDKSLGEQALEMLAKVMTKLRESKGAMNLVTAIKVLDPANRAEIAQLLMDRAAKIPANLWGEQGRPLIKSDAQWVAFFEKRGNVKGEQLVRALRDRLTQDGGASNVKDFNLEMLNRISKLISPTLTIRYVTPATAPSQVIEQAKDNARAWYIATTDGVDTIYVLSTDFKHSGLTTETLLHEILHSAVARTIKTEQDARKANPARKSPLLDIIDDLEGLRKAAEKFITADPELAAKYGPAVKDIDELIAWGMTNLTFQQEVLNKIQVASRTNNNLIAGFKAMINSLVAILFKKTEGREQEILGSGLSVLISNVSDLFTEAENKQTQTINETLNRSQTNTAPDPAFYTTAEIYESLAGVSPAPLAFDGQLRSLLSGIVNKLHGTAGVLHESLMDKQALSAQDVYLKALATGQAPFASATVASGFHFSQQEGFVIEQVEATVRAAINRNENTQSFAYKGLEALYNEAKTNLSPKDFHQGDWNTATQVEKDTAQELYNFLFVLAKSTPSTNPSTGGNTNASADRLAHLSRFAAMGLAHEGVNKLLQGMTGSALVTTGNAAPTSFLARLRALFDQILAWFSDKQTGVKPGDKPDARLEKLVDTLVGIEAKKRASAMARENALFTGLKDASNSVLKAANVGLNKAGVAAARSNNGAVKGVGFVIGAVASGRVSQLIDNGLKFYDTMNGPTPNVLTETIAYVRGATPQMEELFRMGKKLEADRKAFIEDTALNVLSTYKDGGKNLTAVQKKAITSLIRGDAQSLLAAGYTLAQLAEFLGNGTQRQAEITKIEESLKALHPEFYKQFLGQSKQLGFFLATGKGSHENTMLNALNIARMYNTPTMGHLTVAEEQAVQALVDPLVSLYAIEYAPTVLRESAREVLLDESTRSDGENGIAASLAMHAYLLKDSKEKLFDGSEVLRTKGYLPEVYNPRTDIQVADDVEGQILINKGYSVGGILPKDSNDPNPNIQKKLYVRQDSGLVAHVTGMLSLKDMKAKGSAQIGKERRFFKNGGDWNASEVTRVTGLQRNAVTWMAQHGDTFDPRDATGSYMIPTLTSDGDISNYRYEMSHARKDSILERNNNFEHVLGVFAGNTFDKITSAQHNVKVIQALHAHYSVDYAGRSMSYVEVGPNSRDLAMREVYRLLPEATKKEIKRVWGTEAMMVRNDMVTLAFGYRKFSLSEMFDKDPAQRNAAEDLFVAVTTFLVASYARLNLGMDAAQAMQYALRTGVVVKRAEDAWKTISDETKNAIVVKSGIVLLGNVWSNATLLMMHDISLVDIAKHHKTAFAAARSYQEASEELFKLQTQLNTGYNVSNKKALEQRILALKDAIARNPVTELMDVGLMPTIARDIDLSDDMYAYDSNFVKNIKANVAALNPTVLNIGKQLYMTKDTPHYKMLADLTQMSDFVARYTLYQHLTTQAQQPLSKKEAARVSSETFVNYDIPLPKGIQYLDDIGILPFTKYFLSMQRVLLNLVREHPAKVLMTLMANNYLHLMPTVMDSSAFSRFGNNPFRSGPLRFVGAVEHILPIKYAMGLFR